MNETIITVPDVNSDANIDLEHEENFYDLRIVIMRACTYLLFPL